MAEFKIPSHGEICWRELATSDLAAATEFYSQLFGWNIEQSKVTPMAYKEIHINGEARGGMMEIDENWGAGASSSWTTYIAVDDADEAAQRIVANGGALKVPPFDAPGVGRMVLASDPSGAGFALIQFSAL